MAKSDVEIVAAPDTLHRYAPIVPKGSLTPSKAALLVTILDDVICQQKAFLDIGPEWIFEDSLRALAGRIGSTEPHVSRAVKGVRVATHHGDIALRDLFRPGVPLIHGVRRVSQYAVAVRIDRLVETEDSMRPHSDKDLCAILIEEGIGVSRRTVSKYRALRGVPESRRRRGGEWVREPPNKPSLRKRASPPLAAGVENSPPPPVERRLAVLRTFRELARSVPEVRRFPDADVARLLRARGFHWVTAEDIAVLRASLTSD